MMLIDWFTVIAQIVNFLILVWLLKRFLYKPVIAAIDSRQKAVADEALLLTNQKNDADRARNDYASKTADFTKQKDALFAAATSDANAQHQKLMDAARTEVAALKAQQTDALNQERVQVGQSIVQRNSAELFSIVRKALADLASVSLDNSMADVFVARLRSLSPADLGTFKNAFKDSSDTAVISSAFDLQREQQEAIQNAFHDTLGTSASIKFETVPNLVNGIELTSQGYKLSWSVTNYLETLQNSASETLKADHAT